MSYMRGPCYIWRDDTQVHVWAENGYDGWDDASWADGIKRPEGSAAVRETPSGVGIPQEAADLYVVMRQLEPNREVAQPNRRHSWSRLSRCPSRS